MAQKPVEYVIEGGGDDMGVILLLAAAGVGAYIAYKEGWFDKKGDKEPGPIALGPIPLGPAKPPSHKKPPTLGILPGPGDMKPLKPGKGKPAPSPPLMKPLPYIGHGQCLKTGTVGVDGKLGGWAFQNQMDNPGDCRPVLPGYSQAFYGVWAGPKEGWVGKFRDTSAKACALKFENGLSACDMKNLPVSGWKNPPLGLKPPPAVTYCAKGAPYQDYEHGFNWTWDPPYLSNAACPPDKDQASFFGSYKAEWHPSPWVGTLDDRYGNCAKSFGCGVGSIPAP